MKKIILSLFLLLYATVSYAGLWGTGSGGGTVYLADCSSITTGFCVDTSDGTIWYWNGSAVVASGGSGDYTLPTASGSTLGGIKVGTGLDIAAGVLSLDATSNPTFNSINITGSNIASSNKQVTKAWTTGLGYTVDATSVIHGGQHYICTSSHTAGSTTEPGVGASWATVWKVAGGSVVAVDDLSDVDTTGKATGKVLKFNSSGNLIVGDDNVGSGTVPDGTINGQVLQWATDQWVAAALGTASAYNVGTGNNNIVQLNGSGQLPFTIDLMDLTSGGTAISPPGTSGYVPTFSDAGVVSWVDPATFGGSGGYTNLTEFVGQTAYRIFYSDGSGDVTELALGANGTVFKSNGPLAAPSWGTDNTDASSVTVQASDPTSASAQGWYCATGSGDCFYKSSAGLFTLTGSYAADPVTYTLTLDIIDGNATDSVTVNSTPRTTDGTWTGLSSATEPVTCTADTGRTASCTGTGITGSYPDYVADMTQNRSIACTFEDDTPACSTTLASYTTNSAGFAEIFGTTDAGFSFTANATDDICTVKLWVGQILANQNLTLRIGTAKDMSSTYLADSTVAVTTATTGEVEFTLSTTVTGSTTYYVVVDTDAATYGTRAVLNGNGTGTNGFDGTSWVLDASANGRSAYFVIVGDL